MRLHPRLKLVSQARLELSGNVLDITERHNLTYVEVNEILLTIALDFNKHAKRAERHPNDPEKKGDEE